MCGAQWGDFTGIAPWRNQNPTPKLIKKVVKIPHRLGSIFSSGTFDSAQKWPKRSNNAQNSPIIRGNIHYDAQKSSFRITVGRVRAHMDSGGSRTLSSASMCVRDGVAEL